MRDIKPCPFCGGIPHVSRDPCPDGGGAYVSIKCGSCRSKSGEKYFSYGNDCPQTYVEARNDWNTRTPPEATP